MQLMADHKMAKVDQSALCIKVKRMWIPMPLASVIGNLWSVRVASFTLQPMASTNHKFPTAGVIDELMTFSSYSQGSFCTLVK